MSEEDNFKNPPDLQPDELPAGLVSLLNHIRANADFYRVMLGEKGEPAFCAQSFRRRIDEGVRQMLPPGQGHESAGSPQSI